MSDELDQIDDALARLRAGDHSALEMIVSFISVRIQRHAQRIVRQSARLRRWIEVDDICQLATIRVLQRVTKVPPETPSHVISIGIRTTEWVAKDILRKVARQVPPSEVFPCVDGNLQFGAQLDLAAQHEAVELSQLLEFHESVARLPHDLRQVVEHRWYLDLSFTAIARLLGVGQTTVRKRWHQALVALGKSIDVVAADS